MTNQLPLYALGPKADWRPKNVFPSLKNVKRISIDVETCDPNLSKLGSGARRDGYIVGISVAIDGGDSWYLPFRHQGGDNLDKDQVLNWAYEEFKNFTGEVVGARLIYDLDFLAEETITFPNAKRLMDVQIAEPLLNEHRVVYNLDSLSMEYLGENKREELLRQASTIYGFDPKKDLWLLPARYVGAYAEGDVELPLRIMEKQEKLLAEKDIDGKDLLNIWDLECKVLKVLVKMKTLGIKIDEEKLDLCGKHFKAKELECYKKIKEITGIDLNGGVNTPRLVAAVLETQGIKLPRTAKSNQPQVEAALLKKFNNPVADLVLTAKKFFKAHGTFYTSVKEHMTHGRLHPDFNQLRGGDDEDPKLRGTVSGRLSSSHVNIQQQPIRDDKNNPLGIGKLFRSIYIPEDGCKWARFDYSQQEPRLALHYAVKINAPGAQAVADRYWKNPKEDCYTIITTDVSRDVIKETFLSLCYGIGDANLCKRLGYDTKVVVTDDGKRFEVAGEEGQALINRFLEKAPYTKSLNKACITAAAQRGYITTLLGRRCRFPGGYDLYKSSNRLIQGSAADSTKKAMVDLDEAGFIPCIQVHDELGFSIKDNEHRDGLAANIKRIMEQAVSLKVPVIADASFGDSWGDAK